MTVDFDEASMKREADRASARINAQTATEAGAAAAGAQQGGFFGLGVRGVSQAIKNPREFIYEMGETIGKKVADGLKGIPLVGEGMSAAAKGAIEIARAVREKGKADLLKYSQYNADMAQMAAEFEIAEFEHAIEMGGSPGAQASARFYIETEKKLMTAERAMNLSGQTLSELTDPSNVVGAGGMFNLPQVRDQSDDARSKSKNKSVAEQRRELWDPAGIHTSGSPSPLPQTSPSPSPTATEEPIDATLAEESIRKEIERARSELPGASPGANDETRMLVTMFMGNDIGGML
jgi:hypothetical protein